MKSAVKFQRSFEKTKEIKGSKSGELLKNWDNESKEGAPVETSLRMLSENVPSSLCFTIFTSNFFLFSLLLREIV